MIDVLTVLVAGHRPDRLPIGEAGEHLFANLSKVISMLHDSAGNQQATLRVLTGVAKGTDQVTAGIAERIEAPLHLLAAGQKESLTVSQKRAQRTVWLGAVWEGTLGDEAIAIRDEVALSFADLLLVVWDGQSPQGLTGGTVRLAFKAALMMKPVVWLHTDGTVRVLDRKRLDAASLHKLRCPHPDPSWLRDCFTPILDDPSLCKQLTEDVMLTLDPSKGASADDPEQTADEEKRSHDDARRLVDYLTEYAPRTNPIRAGHLDEALMALIRLDFARLRTQLLAKIPRPFWGPVQGGDGHPIAPTPLIDARFERSDVEAAVSAGHHRDATWLIYCASAIAVFSAVAGAIGLWPGEHNVFWPVAELVLIAIIIGGVKLAKEKLWHEKWIGHRFVAEQLRYARMCLPLLGFSQPFMEPAWQASAGRFRLSSAELWFIQRTLTTEGIPRSANGKPYIASSEDVKTKLVDYVSKAVENQQGYHQDKFGRLRAVHKRMHGLSMGLFGATALAVIAHFAIHANWLLICTAFFPALAAAVHGLATKLEIGRIAGQSEATERALADIAVAISEAESQPGWAGWLRLRHLALEASRIMSDENGQWQQLIRHQETELPA